MKPKIVAHTEECPRLKDWTYQYALSRELGQFIRTPETCRCTAAAELRELVEALHALLTHQHGLCTPHRNRTTKNIGCDMCAVVQQIRDEAVAALAPFREQEEK